MKKNLRFVILTFVFAMLIALAPASRGQAASSACQDVRPGDGWVQSGSYAVKRTTSDKLYYKYNGKSVKISSHVTAASINGSNVAFMKSYGDPYCGDPVKVFLYNLKTKTFKSCTIDPNMDVSRGSVAIYGGYIYYTNFDADCGSYHVGAIKISTFKDTGNSISKKLAGYGFYQKGNYLICQRGYYKYYNRGNGLKLFDLKKGAFVKTISSYSDSCAVVGNRLYYVDKKVAASDDKYGETYKYTIHWCSLYGNNKHTFRTSFISDECYKGFAFYSTGVIDCKYVSTSDKNVFTAYSIPSGAKKVVSESTYNSKRAKFYHN